jgi:hypothetical protein
MFFITLGAVGNFSVSRAGDEGDLNFHTASAYWYLLFYVGYPGLAIAVWAALKSKSPLKYVLLGITFAGLVVFMMPQVLNARRGPLFPAIIVLLLVPPMTMRRAPNRLVYCGGLAITAVVMLVFLQVRSVLYTGGSWSEAFHNIDVGNAVVERGGEADDNEYVINCQVIGTTFQNGKYDYGTGHLGLFLHWVPRQVWPAKPVLGEGIYANNEMFDDIEKATGVRLLGSGAADAGVADSFVEYGVLCPFFWFFLGWLVGAVYLKAIRSGSPWWMFCYTGFLCSSHWLISQSFAASFVPGMYFQLIPLGVLAMVWLYRRWSVVPHKTGPRRTLSTPVVPRALPS